MSDGKTEPLSDKMARWERGRELEVGSILSSIMVEEVKVEVEVDEAIVECKVEAKSGLGVLVI